MLSLLQSPINGSLSCGGSGHARLGRAGSASLKPWLIRLWAVPLPPVYRGSCLVWPTWLDGSWLAGTFKKSSWWSLVCLIFSARSVPAATGIGCSTFSSVPSSIHFTTTHTLCWSAPHWSLLFLVSHWLSFCKYLIWPFEINYILINLNTVWSPYLCYLHFEPCGRNTC